MKIKLNLKKIDQHLRNISTHIFSDLFIDLITPYNISRFSIPNHIKKYEEKSLYVINKLRNTDYAFLEMLISINTSYLKTTQYTEISNETLATEFAKHHIPALHNSGVAPEMIILYHYSKHLFNHPEIPFLIEQYRIQETNIMTHEVKNTKLTVELNEKLAYYERTLNCYLNNEVTFPADYNYATAGQALQCTYNPLTGNYDNVPKGIICFLSDTINELHEYSKHIKISWETLLHNTARLNTITEAHLPAYQKSNQLSNENNTLKNRIATLQRNITHLEQELLIKPVDSSNTRDLRKRELEKENYFLKTRIEDLENQLAVLSEEKDINETIETDISSTEIPTSEKPVIPFYSTVIVSGGFWTSDKREAVSKWFLTHFTKCIFIQAEHTLRNFDQIKNADLILFDVSRHSHKYYELIKNKTAASIMHINKSSPQTVYDLFKKGDNNEAN